VKPREPEPARESLDAEIERRVEAARKSMHRSQEVPGILEFAPDRMRKALRQEYEETGCLPPLIEEDPIVAAGRRIEDSLSLYDSALLMTRERLRRERPHASEIEIDRLVAAWIHEHPGAEDGDGVGRPISPERLRRILHE
jgi:Rv0078B-related antitoxin